MSLSEGSEGKGRGKAEGKGKKAKVRRQKEKRGKLAFALLGMGFRQELYRAFMLAIRKIARGKGNIEIQEVPEPHAGAGEVVIEVNSAGICGTDLHVYLDEFETIPPVTIGHELAGGLL